MCMEALVDMLQLLVSGQKFFMYVSSGQCFFYFHQNLLSATWRD
jgi:hypothetical protein